MPDIRLTVCSVRPVFAGERILQKTRGGYVIAEVERDSLYYSADVLIPFEDAAEIVKVIRKERRKRQRKMRKENIHSGVFLEIAAR